MEVTKEHIQLILRYQFSKGNNKSENARNINLVYGNRTISSVIGDSRNYNLKNEPSPEKSVELNKDTLIPS